MLDGWLDGEEWMEGLLVCNEVEWGGIGGVGKVGEFVFKEVECFVIGDFDLFVEVDSCIFVFCKIDFFVFFDKLGFD